ncbi:restriction endonuclease [Saccharopolyspora sp. ID03-671]|uniref:restriction endonuclease n=1 Tax=Saccharopolyspora sp. ID03-671 TaxID=3073066 RepID=UPI003248876F
MRERERKQRLSAQEMQKMQRDWERFKAAEARRAEQEERQRQREAQQAQRAEAQRRREEEKARKAEIDRRERQERERQRAAAAAKREEDARARRAEAEERARKRSEAARKREEVRRKQEKGMDEAAALSKEVDDYVSRLDCLLSERSTGLGGRTATKVSEKFNAEGAPGIEREIARILGESVYPDGFPKCQSEVQYRPESRELIINHELPAQSVVPDSASYKFVKNRGEIQAVPRKKADVQETYARVLAQSAVRVLSESFSASPVSLVSDIVLNGFVSAIDPATGQTIRPCLLSVQVTRDLYDELLLDSDGFDSQACLKRLNAIVSPHPYDLEPVRPVVKFDLSRYKTVAGMDVVAGMDSRMDLLSLKPVEFEHLVRALFEKIGMTSMSLQETRDGGVDAVAYNDDPVLSGLCVIQAKRYKDCVNAESVYALSGTMHDKHATKGILVTTSWFGKDSRDFAERTGRMELIDGRGLKSLLKEHLGLDVLIGLPKLPRGWTRSDVGVNAEEADD